MHIVGLIILLLAIAVIGRKLWSSPRVNAFCDDFANVNKTKPARLCSDVDRAFDKIDKRIESNESVQKRLEQETESINQYKKDVITERHVELVEDADEVTKD